ncbi:hypothetical protein MXB_3200, partial [Myxobolus squamalis]
WDLRTFNLLERASHLINIAVKRTFDDNILFGESIRRNNHIWHSCSHLYNWKKFKSIIGKYVTLYNSKDISQLGNINIFLNIVKIKFYTNLLFSNISNDCTKIVTGVLFFHLYI